MDEQNTRLEGLLQRINEQMEVKHSAHSKHSMNPFHEGARNTACAFATVGGCLSSLHRDSGQKNIRIPPPAFRVNTMDAPVPVSLLPHSFHQKGAHLSHGGVSGDKGNGLGLRKTVGKAWLAPGTCMSPQTIVETWVS